MGHLKYSALNKQKIDSQNPLFSYWTVLLAFTVVLFALVYLFPQSSLKSALLNQSYISEVDLQYSLLFSSGDNGVTYSEIIASPEKVIDKLLVQLSRLNPKEGATISDLWLNYIILRSIAFRPKLNTRVSTQVNQALLAYLNAFRDLPLRDNQFEQLARDALAFHQAPYALFCYEKLLARNPERSVDFFAQAAKVALWAKNCVKSSEYQFISEHKSMSLVDKRYFYLQGLKALFQCEQFELAIQMAEKNINGLSEDIETYQALIDLAIKADKPALAQKFVFKFLQLKNKSSLAPTADPHQ